MALLQYDLGIIGEAKVAQALAGVERKFAQHNRAVERGARSRMGGQGATGQLALSVARDQTRAEAKLTKDRERAEAHVFRVRMRHFQQIQREEEALARELERSTESRARREQRIVEMKSRRAAALVESETRDRARNTERSRRNTIGTMGGSVRRTVGGMANIVGAGLAIGGGFAVGDAVSRQLDLSRRYTQLAVQSSPSGQVDLSKRDKARSRVEALSVERGIAREDLTGALEVGVQKTGDLDKSLENLERFAVLGQAFNSTTEDIASAAATLQSKFGLTTEEMGEAMATLGNQGRKAAFELKDMASLAERIATAGERFDLQGAEGVKTLGGLAQITRTSEGTPESTATAIESGIAQLLTKTGQIQSGKAFKSGKKVDVFEGGDERNDARPIREVLTDIVAATEGRQSELIDIFGTRGVSMVAKLSTAYKGASQAAGGGKAGDAAGRAAIETVLSNAIDSTGTYADAVKDAAIIVDDGAAKTKKAQEEIAIALGELSPLVVDLAGVIAANKDTIKKAVEGLVDIVKYLVENPFKGIGAIIAAKLVADIAAATIGEKIRDALLAASRPPGTPVPTPGSGGAVPVPGAPGGKAPTGMAATSSLGVLGYAAVGAAIEEGVYSYANEGQKDTKFRSGRDVAGRVKDNLTNNGWRGLAGKTIIGELADGTVQNADALLERTGLGTIDEHLGEGTRSKIGSFLTGGGRERVRGNGTNWGGESRWAAGHGAAGLSKAAAELTKAAEAIKTAVDATDLNRSASPTTPKR